MIEDVILSFIKLIFSVETIVIVIGYLLMCHLFISRTSTLSLSLILQCFWAICFTFLFVRVFFVGSQAFALISSYWIKILVALLLSSIVPATVHWFFTNRSIFPPLLGLFDVFWFAAITQVILWDGKIVVLPPFYMLMMTIIIAIVVSALVGFFLISASTAIFGERAMKEGIVFYRLAGMLTVYIPLCLYGACLRSLFH